MKMDEAAGVLFYTARDGDNYLKMQLHRVGLDGKDDLRLTDPGFHHTVGSCWAAGRAGALSGALGLMRHFPDNRYFVDVYQTHESPPATRVVDATTGKIVVEARAERPDEVRRSSASGRPSCSPTRPPTARPTLHGHHAVPVELRPVRRSIPLLVSVYGGPASASNTARETFVHAERRWPSTGSSSLSLDSRAAPGQGKQHARRDLPEARAGRDRRHGEGVKALWNRPYFDKTRVGIYGTSYGGYSSVMSLLRHPDVFAAASASSPVTAWNHYDTIYTERYMWTPGGEQGRVRRRQRHDLREGSEGPADAVLRHGRQQRPSVEHDAARHGAPAGGQELRPPGRPGPRATAASTRTA